jgi:hypothetical protein
MQYKINGNLSMVNRSVVLEELNKLSVVRAAMRLGLRARRCLKARAKVEDSDG